MQPRTLEQMQYCRTRYEVELIAGGNRRIIGYTARKTRDALYEYARQHGDEILRVLGDPENIWFTHRTDEIVINDEVTVRFTGRTERDARMAIDRVAVLA
jgi:hypothetical protein